MSFHDMLNDDLKHTLSSSEFGISCYNETKDITFEAIFKSSYKEIDELGNETISDSPYLTMSDTIAISQNDKITIDTKSYLVKIVNKSGAGMLDILLKDYYV